MTVQFGFPIACAGFFETVCHGAVVTFWGLACTLLGAFEAIAQTPVTAEFSSFENKTPSEVAAPAVVGVYRSTGASGEVEFNNFGKGEPVALVVAAPSDGVELERVASRTQTMLDVAMVLAADRQVRENSRAARRAEIRQARAAAARDKAQMVKWRAAAQPRYFPAYFSRPDPHYGRRHRVGARPDWRAGPGSSMKGYRYPGPHAVFEPAPGGVIPKPVEPAKRAHGL